MSNLASLTTIGTMADYVNGSTVDATEQNNNENTSISKINQIVSALVTGIPELALANTFTLANTFSGGIKTDSIQSTTGSADVILNNGTFKYGGTGASQEIATQLYVAQQIAAGVVSPVVMTGATGSVDGASGLVHQPVAGDNVKFLKGDATWSEVSYAEVDTAWTDIDNTDSSYSATAGEALRVDTSSASVTVTLEAAPSNGDKIRMLDKSGTFGTNACVLGRNGKNIMGLAEDMSLQRSYASYEFTFFSSNNDWRATS